MSSFLTAKQVLLAYDITSPTNEEGKKLRGTAHEFQDYAYRLAADLNDLEHLPIYMRLVRSYPRFLLEQVYSSIADINEFNKGKLFMWKFKQVRLEAQKKKNLVNYEYEYVLKTMRSLRNDLSEALFKKYDDISQNILAQFLILNKLLFDEQYKSILFLGTASSLLPSMFDVGSKKIYGIDIAPKVTERIKQSVIKSRVRSFITKDFLKNSYSDLQFDGIILQYIWSMIPIESELAFLKELFRVTSVQGKIILPCLLRSESKQSWKPIMVKNIEEFYFEKVNKQNEIEKVIHQAGFAIETMEEMNGQVVYVLAKEQ